MENRMFIEKLDRQQWTIAQAERHILNLCLERHRREKAKLPEEQNPPPIWVRPPAPAPDIAGNARSELFIALRDGDLHAKGRLSTLRRESYSTGFSAWEYHSGYHEPISPMQWRGGRVDYDNQLEYADGQFIDIRIPRFMVLAIWPELPAEMPDQSSETDFPYTTPYLDLMQAAIRIFGISALHQDKKEAIVAWLLEREIEGEPLSRNLAEAMATLIRLPSAQRGGAKRMIGPDLRDVG
jgi:hypothetical protein